MGYLEFTTHWDFNQFERFLQGYHAFKSGLGIIGYSHMTNYHFTPDCAPNLGFDFILPDGTTKPFSAKSYRSLARMLTRDKDVMLASVSVMPSALRYAAKPLRSDKEIVLTAVKKDPFVLEYAGKTMKEDDDVVLAAVSRDSYVLRYVSERYLDNLEIMKAAVAENPFALRYASDRLKDDEALVLLAVTQRPDVLRHASDRIRRNPSFLRAQTAGIKSELRDREDGFCPLDEQILVASSQKRQALSQKQTLEREF